MSALNIEPAYLERAAAASFLGISESTLEKLVREDDAPKPRQVSPKRVAWLVRELRAWAETRPVSGQLPPPNTGSRRAKAVSSQRPGPRAWHPAQ
jgi:prophage regulatory protein